MVDELTRLTVRPADEAAFEAAVARCAPLFRAAAGCTSMRLDRLVDEPGRYLLRVAWRSVEDHTVTFKSSPAYRSWREAVGPFFAEPPEVIHTTELATYF